MPIPPDFFNSDGPPALPPGLAGQPIVTRTLPPLNRTTRAAVNLPFNQAIQERRLSLQEFHARVLDEKRWHEMSMDQARVIDAKARLLLDLVKTKAELLDRYRKTISSAAAIDAVSKLDITVPRFEKDFYDLAAKHADDLSNPQVEKWFLQKKQDYQAAKQAALNRAMVDYSTPAAKTYQDTLALTGDASWAKATADGVQKQTDRAKALATSPYLSAAERASVFDPATKHFNLDPDALDALEVTARQKEKEKEMADASFKNAPAAFYSGVVKEHGLTAQNLNEIDATPGVITYRDSAGQPVSAQTVQGKTDKYNASVRLGNIALDIPLNKFNEMMQTHRNLQAQQTPSGSTSSNASSPAPAPGESLADQETKRLLGIDLSPSPTPPTATATPPLARQAVAAATSGKPDQVEQELTVTPEPNESSDDTEP